MTNLKKKHISRLVIIIILLTHSVLQATPIILSDSVDEHHYWSERHSFFIDEDGHHTVESISKIDFGKLNPKHDQYHLAPNETRWYRIDLVQTGHKGRLLEFPDSHIKSVAVFKDNKNNTFTQFKTSGFIKSVSKREVKHKNHIFELPLSHNERATFYVKITSDLPSSPMYHIRSWRFYLNYSSKEYAYLGIFYGMLIIMILYNTLLYSATSSNIYLYYSLYLFGCIAFTLGEDSIGSHLVWHTNGSFNGFLFQYGPFIWVLGFTFFANSFLQLKKSNVIKSALLFLPALFISVASVLNWGINQWLIPLPVVLALYMSISKLKQGHVYARFFVIGYFIVLIGLFMYLLRVSNYIYSNTITYYFTYFTFVLEAIVFSLAISERIRLIKLEKTKAQERVIDQLRINDQLKDKVNAELELKVQERTIQLENKSKELSDANLKLQNISSELQLMNEKMDIENWKLQREIKEKKKKNLNHPVMNFITFQEVYPDNNACRMFLSDLKWTNGYKCQKCGNEKHFKGDKYLDRKCTVCKHNESAIFNTIYQGIRFDLLKAFYITYISTHGKSNITIDSLSEEINLRRNTTWSFRKKICDLITKKKPDNWTDIIMRKT